jgi:nitrite transporter NirC
VGEFIAATAATKMSVPFFPLLLRGVLCNVLVCLAVWCNFRCKSESGKLIMIFWCLFAFITSSFEHSIANMTLLTVALFAPFEAAVSVGGYFYNILVVTLGNMLGGILFIALPYYVISKKKEG